ncbi:T9SS type A sorting domain-containing protein, partial [Flaviaesturariibacter amylovorans]|uniref:T9SS type A sorting domain-containing protein n=1 Tax=Flaviaesturariibacter amylovorans TaxID=1084520 RepID=UPI0031EBDC45
KVSVGPNPTQNRVTVYIDASLKTGAAYSVRLVDQHGAALMRPASFTGTSYTLDLTGLTSGTYLVQLTDTRTGETVQKKVIKL